MYLVIKMKNNTLQIRISEKARQQLEARAEEFGVTPNEYLRSLILEDLKAARHERRDATC